MCESDRIVIFVLETRFHYIIDVKKWQMN